MQGSKSQLNSRLCLLATLLMPASGCATTLPSMPWLTTQPKEVTASSQPDRVAKNELDVFQVASFQATQATDTKPATVSKSATDWTLAELRKQKTVELLTSLPPLVAPDADADAAVEITEIPAATEPILAAGLQMIDLSSALGMAGANAWTIQLARQQTVEAHAGLQRAQALWLPSLQFGVGWNKHDGRIQATPGQVIEASRGSLFMGGGATLGNAPIAGGSGGPVRLFADLALADAYFAPKIAERGLSARRWGISTAKNEALRDAGLAYLDLLESSGRVADAAAAINDAEKLVTLTRNFADAGAGARADVDRAETARSALDQQMQDAKRMQLTRAAKLARRLRLDPRLSLHPAESFVVPIELMSDQSSLDSLIANALTQRPEINERCHQIHGAATALRQANVDPWIPRVAVASSTGSYSGGTGSNLDNQGSRSDIDLLAVWELDSLGVGVIADRRRAKAQLAQQRTQLADLRDQISTEVVTALRDVQSYREQISLANQAMELAESSYQLNLQRVRADEGLPIELLQAINARALALSNRTTAVAHYNRAQIRLLHATGALGQSGG